MRRSNAQRITIWDAVKKIRADQQKAEEPTPEKPEVKPEPKPERKPTPKVDKRTELQKKIDFNKKSARDRDWSPSLFGEDAFDEDLVKAITKFQEDNEIKVDGKAGKNTVKLAKKLKGEGEVVDEPEAEDETEIEALEVKPGDDVRFIVGEDPDGCNGPCTPRLRILYRDTNRDGVPDGGGGGFLEYGENDPLGKLKKVRLQLNPTMRKFFGMTYEEYYKKNQKDLKKDIIIKTKEGKIIKRKVKKLNPGDVVVAAPNWWPIHVAFAMEEYKNNIQKARGTEQSFEMVLFFDDEESLRKNQSISSALNHEFAYDRKVLTPNVKDVYAKRISYFGVADTIYRGKRLKAFNGVIQHATYNPFGGLDEDAYTLLDKSFKKMRNSMPKNVDNHVKDPAGRPLYYSINEEKQFQGVYAGAQRRPTDEAIIVRLTSGITHASEPINTTILVADGQEIIQNYGRAYVMPKGWRGKENVDPFSEIEKTLLKRLGIKKLDNIKFNFETGFSNFKGLPNYVDSSKSFKFDAGGYEERPSEDFKFSKKEDTQRQMKIFYKGVKDWERRHTLTNGQLIYEIDTDTLPTRKEIQDGVFELSKVKLKRTNLTLEDIYQELETRDLTGVSDPRITVRGYGRPMAIRAMGILSDRETNQNALALTFIQNYFKKHNPWYKKLKDRYEQVGNRRIGPSGTTGPLVLTKRKKPVKTTKPGTGYLVPPAKRDAEDVYGKKYSKYKNELQALELNNLEEFYEEVKRCFGDQYYKVLYDAQMDGVFGPSHVRAFNILKKHKDTRKCGHAPEEDRISKNYLKLIKFQGAGSVRSASSEKAYAQQNLINFLNELGQTGDEWIVGDMSSQIGGKIPAHHSHKVGLDLDIAYRLKNNSQTIFTRESNPERFNKSVNKRSKYSRERIRNRGWEYVPLKAREKDDIDYDAFIKLIGVALKHGVAKIFVSNKPKEGLYIADTIREKVKEKIENGELDENVYKFVTDKSYRLLQHWPNHRDHMHIRFGPDPELCSNPVQCNRQYKSVNTPKKFIDKMSKEGIKENMSIENLLALIREEIK